VKKLKVFSFVFLFFFIFFVGLHFYIKKEYSPEKLRKIVLVQLEKKFPKAKFKLKTFKTSIQLGLNIELKELEIRGDHNDLLLEVKKVNCSIPFLSLFKNNKSINLDFFGPKFFYKETKKGSNFRSSFLGSEKNSIQKNKKDGDLKFTLPLLKNLNMDVNFYKIVFTYEGKGGLKKIFLFERFSMKNIGVSKKIHISADSKVFLKKLGKKKTRNFFNVDIEGEIQTKKFLKFGIINGALDISVYNFYMRRFKLPPIKNKIKFELRKNGDLEGSWLSKMDGDNEAKINFLLNKKGAGLKKININLNLNRFLGDISDRFHLNKTNVKVTGSLKIIKKKIYPFLKTHLTTHLKFNGSDSNLKIKTIGSIQNKKFKLYTRINAFSGLIEKKVRADLNVNDLIYSKKKLPYFNTMIKARGLIIPKTLMSRILKERTMSKKVEKTKDKKKGTQILSIPPGKVSLDFKDVKVGHKNFELKGSVVIKKDALAAENLRLKYGTSDGRLTLFVKKSKISLKTKFKLDIKKLNLVDYKVFFPSKWGRLKGLYSINSNGEFELINKSHTKIYNLIFNIDGLNTEIEKIKIKNYFKKYLDNIPLLKIWMKDWAPKFRSEIKKLNLNGRLSYGRINFKRIELQGEKDSFHLLGHGVLYPQSSIKKGRLFFQVRDRKGGLSHVLEKNIGLSSLPIKLITEQLTVKPDYPYTIKKMAEIGYEKKGKEKIKKIIKKKLEPILKEKIKNLLDLF
jgi:hypothetical protein